MPKFKDVARDNSTPAPASISDITFGVELEIDKGLSENRSSCARSVLKACPDDIYLKHDGSLDTGFEIVTHPCTLRYHREVFTWGAICEEALDHGFKSHDARTCGLHVHVGRSSLGRGADSKLCVLMDRLWEPMVKFSRRKENQLSSWAGRPYINYDEPVATLDEFSDNVSDRNTGSRYAAVNLTNSATIEFRLFNGSLLRETILASIEMVSNFCEYARDHTLDEVFKAQWTDVAYYRIYPELDSYLADKSLDTWGEIPVRIPSLLSDLDLCSEVSVGDRVKIVRFHQYCNELRYSVGDTATVHSIEGEDGSLEYGLVFDEASSYFHDLMGECEPNHGYWVRRDVFVPVV